MNGAPEPLRRRPPAVAGTFYPADPLVLRNQIDDLLVAATATVPANAKAIVAPHAGLVFSGPIAATAYRAIEDRAADVRRVVLLGPSHRVAHRGVAVPTVDRFVTPLGDIELDHLALEHLVSLPGVTRSDGPHAREHSLEVQLPFLQRTLGDDWNLVPMAVGRAPAADVANVLAAVWGGPETLVVVSSDLSHYHDYQQAAALDRRTAAAIVARDVDAIFPTYACGVHPLRGLLEIARRADLAVEQLDLRSSGDTAGDRSSVVGYGAFAIG